MGEKGIYSARKETRCQNQQEKGKKGHKCPSAVGGGEELTATFQRILEAKRSVEEGEQHRHSSKGRRANSQKGKIETP